MAALSGKNPAMSMPLAKDDCALLNIVMYYEDMPTKFDDVELTIANEDQDEEFDDEVYQWEDDENTASPKKMRSKHANT